MISCLSIQSIEIALHQLSAKRLLEYKNIEQKSL